MPGVTEPPRLPPGLRIYAIGDIHGRLDLLRRLIGLIQADDAARPVVQRSVLIYLGDYIDRGPESRGVIEFLIGGPPSGFDAVHLKGNHEDAMLRFLDDLEIGMSWLAFGAVATLSSYGAKLPGAMPALERLRRVQTELRRILPVSHRDFIRRMPLRLVLGDYLFVHAGVRPGVALEHQDEQDLMWIRDEFLYSSANFGKVVVHGHTISERPEIRANRIGIDTGAYATGHLTCLMLDGAQRQLLTT
ncbi:serine/threonine protein phosphatase 1 [uncultured Gammaproteobacteria bacterium]